MARYVTGYCSELSMSGCTIFAPPDDPHRMSAPWQSSLSGLWPVRF
eukprot:CAMPEP_0119089588 /NCGR_PEP_ID=MMETSP1178-20130426/149547_1 /TAXON_ID=33656 /ORGANISM="unid sp, Strain CCMP2000" /LENGTH=45 /DNA_ID= /DNA_START= /DNA_END= /DNA_ORIENTATION=